MALAQHESQYDKIHIVTYLKFSRVNASVLINSALTMIIFVFYGRRARAFEITLTAWDRIQFLSKTQKRISSSAKRQFALSGAQVNRSVFFTKACARYGKTISVTWVPWAIRIDSDPILAHSSRYSAGSLRLWKRRSEGQESAQADEMWNTRTARRRPGGNEGGSWESWGEIHRRDSGTSGEHLARAAWDDGLATGYHGIPV